MNKMNLREFAEVLVAMLHQQGTVCFLNNDNPAKQLAVAMSKGDAYVYAPVAPLWDDYEKGRDINQIAVAVSVAMKEELKKGVELAKEKNAKISDIAAQQKSEPLFKKHAENQPTVNTDSSMKNGFFRDGCQTSQQKAKSPKREFFPDTEEGRQKAMKMLQDIMGDLPDTMTAPDSFSNSNSGYSNNNSCNGNCYCGSECKVHQPQRPEMENDDYGTMGDLPDNLRSQLDEILKRMGLQPQNKEDKLVNMKDRNFVLRTVYPMLVDDVTVAAHPGALVRKILDMNLMYVFYNNNTSNGSRRILSNTYIKDMGLREEDVYNAALNNIAHDVVATEASNVAPSFVNFIILHTEKYKYGAASFLGANVLENVADRMNEHALMVMPISDEYAAVFPMSDKSINGAVLKNIIKTLKNFAPDEVLSDKVYLYDREHNLLAMESYQL